MFKFAVACLISSALWAGHGQTFKIEERNPMQAVLEKLASISGDKVAEIQVSTREEVLTQLKRPAAVAGLEEVREYQFYYYDPIYKVVEEITDLKGNIIAEKGKMINPLDNARVLQDLILFDGTNSKHTEWAKSQPHAKWILVKGSPIELEDATDHPVFFDQGGVICRKFGVQRVPTKISKSSGRILIEEIPCDS